MVHELKHTTNSRRVASHNSLLQSLGSLRDEITKWEEEAYRRIQQAELEFIANKSLLFQRAFLSSPGAAVMRCDSRVEASVW
jgi:hypothetical protein